MGIENVVIRTIIKIINGLNGMHGSSMTKHKGNEAAQPNPLPQKNGLNKEEENVLLIMGGVKL